MEDEIIQSFLKISYEFFLIGSPDSKIFCYPAQWYISATLWA